MTHEHLIALLREIYVQEGALPLGATPPTRPQRNMNPGDLRGAGWQGQVGEDKGQFCVFRPLLANDVPDPQYLAEMDELDLPHAWYWGYRASRLDVSNHATGHPNQDLQHFIAGGQPEAWTGYAPASDSNDSTAYALALARALGVETTTTFAQL